ncbi:MAG TPA: hypothetical protein VM735_12350, partial [Candidatus Kapabacteria bacterium]|nr:hypothetical protein [Candidatus Kapabacteria bacterium]
MKAFRSAWACAFLFSAGLVCSGAEIPVRDGLVLAFDASEQASMRASKGVPALGRFQPADLVFDSVKGQRAVQLAPERRPVFVADDEAAFFRFDGKDDLLVCDSVVEQAEELTIFILAAPTGNDGMFSGIFGAAELGKNDYTSGINLDFGPGATTNLS